MSTTKLDRLFYRVLEKSAILKSKYKSGFDGQKF